MTLQFNPYAVPLFISAVSLVIILYVAWQRRSSLAARMFLGFTGGALGLVLAYAMELLSADLDSMLFWLNFEYLFHSALVFWPLFALAYSGYETAITRRRVLGLFIVPAIVFVLIVSNEAHGLIYSSTGVRVINSVVLFDRTYGVVFWIWIGYLAALFVAGYVVLFSRAMRSPGYFRGQVGWLALALLFPAVGVVLTRLEVNPFPLIDLTPYGIGLACIPLAISLFRYQLFQLIPAAHEQVFESMDDAVIVCDARYRIVQTNSAAVTLIGRPEAQLLGCSVEQVLSEFTNLNLEQRFFDTAGAHELITSESGVNKRYFDLRVSPLRDQRRMITGHVLVLREITDRTRAEQQALDLAIERERVQVLKRFIQDASHDFRTPISAIMTSVYLLDKLGASASARLTSLSQSTAEPSTEQSDLNVFEINDTLAKMREKAQGVHASAVRLEKLVESMLEVTQLESASHFEFELHDLNNLVEESVQAHRAAAAAKQLMLEFEPDSAKLPVYIDRYKLGRALRQLVENAIHYTPHSGTIRILTNRNTGDAVIEIHDTGIGIDAAELNHIFEQFYRADKSRSASTGGAGLGLFIAKRIIEAHDGRIEVESAVAHGSVFRVRLPLEHPRTALTSEKMVEHVP